jgi:NADH-quinone oxidoreductase subunit J
MALQILFFIVAILTLGSAIGTVIARNLFHAALFLIGTFAGVAVFYVLLQAEFLAVTQVVVYIGAIATLIIFAIMLTRSVMGREAGALNQWAGVVAVASVLIVAALAWLFTIVKFDVNPQSVPDDAIAQIGEGFVTTYVIPFEVASVLLLVALIGAIMLARERHQ